MKSIYFDSPSAAVALNFKVGSSSLARAVIASHHPAIEARIHTAPGTGDGVAYPTGHGPETIRWQGLCPKVKVEDRPVTLVPVRDPVEKFRSACVESRVTDIDAKLTQLESGGSRDPHFWPQSRLLEGQQIKLYRFPTDLDALATEAGLSLPLPTHDGGNNPEAKPDLTPEQLAQVEAIYADDIVLYNSITEAGQEYVPVPIPPSAEEIESAQRQAAYDAAAAVFESLSKGVQALWEPTRVAVAAAVLQGDMAEAVEILMTTPVIYEGAEAHRQLFLDLFSQ